MSGIGENAHPKEWAELQKAIQKYGQAVYDDDYITHEFVMVGFVVSMAEDNETSEYVLATSAGPVHINEGLLRRGLDMIIAEDED